MRYRRGIPAMQSPHRRNAYQPGCGIPHICQAPADASRPQEDGFTFRTNPLPALAHSSTTLAEPEIAYLQQMTQVYYDRVLAPSSKSTYSAGQQRFTSFCKSAKEQSMPASESTLLLFATHLATSSISYATIKIYLSAVGHMHITAGMDSFFNQQLTPQLQQVLKGIQKSQSLTHPPRVRLPIIIQIMENIL